MKMFENKIHDGCVAERTQKRREDGGGEEEEKMIRRDDEISAR